MDWICTISLLLSTSFIFDSMPLLLSSPRGIRLRRKRNEFHLEIRVFLFVFVLFFFSFLFFSLLVSEWMDLVHAFSFLILLFFFFCLNSVASSFTRLVLQSKKDFFEIRVRP